MRKLSVFFLPLFFALAAFAFLPAVTASADTPFPNARTTTDGVVFFRTPENPFFFLHKGYYLELTTEDVNGTHYKAYYHQSSNGYARLEGYVLKSDVTVGNIRLASSADTNYYPVAPATLKIDTGLSSEAAPGTFSVPVDKDKTVYYYGSKIGTDGNTWHYVMYDSFRGYIPNFAIDKPVITEHPSLNPPVIPKDPDPTPPANNTQPDFVKWVLISGISVPAVIIVILLFRPNKRTQPTPRIPSFMEEFDELEEP